MKNLSKDNLEIINSFSWFFMDAFWMTEELGLSYFCIVPTLISGVLLLFKERAFSSILVALSALLWASMNSLWLLGDSLEIVNYLIVCKILFGCGIISLILAIFISDDIGKTLAVFRRFKVKKA